ncbi:MAG TPA: hypothetical protein VGJ20_44335 [Xanthobacteraceae bacterium]|jgi:hypothetical protein
MRVHRVLVMVGVLILGLGAWQFFSPTKIAAVGNNDLDVLQMQRDLKDLPAHNLRDFTLVFDAD